MSLRFIPLLLLLLVGCRGTTANVWASRSFDVDGSDPAPNWAGGRAGDEWEVGVGLGFQLTPMDTRVVGDDRPEQNPPRPEPGVDIDENVIVLPGGIHIPVQTDPSLLIAASFLVLALSVFIGRWFLRRRQTGKRS